MNKWIIHLCFWGVLLTSISVFSFSTFSQGEKNIWYFGEKAGLDFRTGGVPSVLTDSAMDAVEGSSSVADSDGNLLFYSNGATVWNKNHQVMANGNGLVGNIRSTNTSYIVKKPGSESLYYLFTLDVNCVKVTCFCPNYGLSYNIIDMSRDGGLGEVIEKNTRLEPATSEQVMAIGHSNGKDVWLVSHQPTFNRINARLITSEGISMPISSPVFQSLGGETCNSLTILRSSIGYMKGSPNGSKIAILDYIDGEVALYRFDSSTGTAIKGLKINTGGKPYGVEFSPNSQLLYVSFAEDDFSRIENHIKQYNLSEYNQELVVNSERKIISPPVASNFPYGAFGAMQLGPDDKIYIASRDIGDFGQENFISVINSPNSIGSFSDIKVNSISLEGKKSTFGLPIFFYQKSSIDFYWEDICEGDLTNFFVIGSEVSEIKWDFGDPGSSTNNSSTEKNPSHEFSAPGTYTVRVNATSNFGEVQELEHTVTVYPYPEPISNSTYTVTSFFPATVINFQTLDTLVSRDRENEVVQYFKTEELAELSEEAFTDPLATETGTLYAKVSNKFSSCFRVVPIDVEVIIVDEEVVNSACRPLFPTAFSPNGNGVNDRFVNLTPEEHDCEIQIESSIVLDRWGNTVYSSEGVIDWDGILPSGEVPRTGVYLYSVVYSFSNEFAEGEHLKTSGSVRIIR